MRTRWTGLLCVLALLAPCGTPAKGQSGSAESLPDPALLEMLRFPTRAAAEVPTQQAFGDWPPAELRQRPYWLPFTWQSFQRAGLFQRPVVFVLMVNWSQPVRKVMAGPLANREILRQLNDGYVAVLANADRRPDLRERYHTGDWPVIAFLTPDGNPMLSQANDMGVARPITTSQVDTRTLEFLLTEGTKYWEKWPRLLLDVGREWARRSAATEGTSGVPDELASDLLSDWLGGNADRSDGGFGAAPKFLVRGFAEYAAIRSGRLKNELLSHSRLTLEQLVASPLYDEVEGGMHRLAAAPGWGVIQYEKRLVDNAELIQQLLVELRREPTPALREALAGTAGFVVETLGRPGGGFFNAQSADPLTPDGGGYWQGPVRNPGRKPPIDPLVLAGPNALAGAAVIRAGRFLEDDALVAAGREAVELVRAQAYAPGQGVRHVIEPDPEGHLFLAALADVALGFLGAYEATGDRRLLESARDVADVALQRLKTEDHPALMDYAPQAQPVGLLAIARYPLRPNARMARALVRLSLFGAGDGYRKAAADILSAWAGNLAPFGVQAAEAALAIEESIREPLRIRVHGAPDNSRAQALRAAALASPWPWTLVDTGEGRGKPRATFEWRGGTFEADDPDELTRTVLEATGLDAR